MVSDEHLSLPWIEAAVLAPHEGLGVQTLDLSLATSDPWRTFAKLIRTDPKENKSMEKPFQQTVTKPPVAIPKQRTWCFWASSVPVGRAFQRLTAASARLTASSAASWASKAAKRLQRI